MSYKLCYIVVDLGDLEERFLIRSIISCMVTDLGGQQEFHEKAYHLNYIVILP